MEAEAARTRIQLQTVLDSTPALIVALDEKGQITLINRFALNLLGYTEEELLGRNWFDTCLPQPEGREHVYPVFRRIMAGEIAPVEEFENTVLCRNGRQPLIAWRNTSMTDEHGRIVGTLSSGMDITERKRAEEVLRLHKLVVETAKDGFWMVDMMGNLRGANEAYARMSGYTVDELLNMHISQLDVAEKSVGEVAAHSAKIIAQGSDRFEARHRRKDGQEIDVEVSVRYMPETQSFFSFLHDITERKRAEHELRDLNERLEERVEQRTRELTQAKQLAESANRIKSEFLANMSHEIRTPMNSILGMAHLALNVEADRRNQGYLKKIQSSGEHLLGIIDDILDFSKLDAGKLRIDTVDFDLPRVLENVNILVAGKAAAKGLELVFDTEKDFCLNLRGDPLRLAQILANYVDNAIKFTEKGRIILRTMRIEESNASCLVRFEVQDSGIGIGEAEKAKLFQPFQQIDASSTRRYGGTGLGLVICKQLAEMMLGEVGVDSVPGQGSTFWLSVRLEKTGMPCCVKSGNGADVPSAMLAVIRGARILLAENNLFNQQVATEFLENAGATVCVAQNGKEALDLLDKDRFDCVLMDIQMPVLDGFEATRLIRSNPALAGIPVIAMTANVLNEDRERCLGAGMNDFISKPFKPHAFYAVIAKWLLGGEQRIQIPGTPAAAAAKITQANDSGVIDFAALAELMGGNKLKMREFSLKFLVSARQDMAEVDAALERKDVAALGMLGHHIRSPARMAGAMGFADLCQTLEGYGKGGANIEQIREVVSQMRTLLDRINEQVNKELP